MHDARTTALGEATAAAAASAPAASASTCIMRARHLTEALHIVPRGVEALSVPRRYT